MCNLARFRRLLVIDLRFYERNTELLHPHANLADRGMLRLSGGVVSLAKLLQSGNDLISDLSVVTD